MTQFVGAIQKMTDANTDYRHVVFTGQNLQLVLMALQEGEEIGTEVHATHDQFFRIEAGNGRLDIEDQHWKIKAGDGFVVPAGQQHNVTNTGKKRLRLYTIYAPPNHAAGLIASTRAEAVLAETAQQAARAVDSANKVMTNEGGPAPSMQPAQP